MEKEVGLKVENLTTSYKSFRLSGVNFELKSGDILGLIGRSGSGKSTLLKTLIGLKKQDKGEIKVYKNNRRVPLKNVIGYSPQENSLFRYLTVEENILIFSELYNLKQRDVQKRMDSLLDWLNIENARHRKIVELSGGMQKRADLAVTLIHDPHVIVLDEPFNGLDISLQRFIWHLITDLAKQGKILIISSHMLTDIKNHCNQFGLIHDKNYYGTEQVLSGLRKRKMEFETYMGMLFHVDE